MKHHGKADMLSNLYVNDFLCPQTQDKGKVINEKQKTPHGIRVAFGRFSRNFLEGWGYNKRWDYCKYFNHFFFSEKEKKKIK